MSIQSCSPRNRSPGFRACKASALTCSGIIPTLSASSHIILCLKFIRIACRVKSLFREASGLWFVCFSIVSLSSCSLFLGVVLKSQLCPKIFLHLLNIILCHLMIRIYCVKFYSFDSWRGGTTPLQNKSHTEIFS